MAYAGVLTVSNRPNPPTIHMHMWCQLQKKNKNVFTHCRMKRKAHWAVVFLAGQVGSNSISYQCYGI